MGKKNKLKKFGDLLSYPNVYENYDPKYPKLVVDQDKEIDMKGRWASFHFNNNNPLVLELACGRGEYTEALAAAYPNQNFIGVDVKGARIWQGATNTLNKGLSNAAFLRTRIEQIALFFNPAEVDEIWITFPDPYPKKAHEHRRMTAPHFLQNYRNIIKPKGIVHFKTDNDDLFDFTLKSLEYYNLGLKIHDFTRDLHSTDNFSPEVYVLTRYERGFMAQGKNINYISFSFDN